MSKETSERIEAIVAMSNAVYGQRMGLTEGTPAYEEITKVLDSLAARVIEVQNSEAAAETAPADL